MKKRIAALLAVITAVSLFSGCGKNGEEEKDSKPADVTVSEEDDTFDRMNDDASPVTEVTAADMPVVTSSEVTQTNTAASYISEIMFIGDEMCGGFSSLDKVNPSMVVYSDGAQAADISSLSGKVSEIKPKYIYLWIGKNDLSYCNDYKFYTGVKDIVSSLSENSPDSVIAVLSLPAVTSGGDWDMNNCDGGASYDISVYNDVLRQVVDEAESDKIVFLDIASPLEDENGDLSAEYDSGDGLTLNDAGYQALASYIEANRFSNDSAGGVVSESMPVVSEAPENDETSETISESETTEPQAEVSGREDLKAVRPSFTKSDPKVCYLTFDDGPSENTEKILDILKENDIKATFFIVGWCVDGREDILKRIADEGHTIGIHTYSHDYEEIYSSVDAYVDDFAKAYDKIYEVTGIKPWLFRYPGGSYNSFNEDIADDIISEMNNRGFTYFDWSCATSDATVGATYNSCIESFKDSLTNDYETVLMHDSKELTVEYLQDIINYAKGEGYKFETLDTAEPIRF